MSRSKILKLHRIIAILITFTLMGCGNEKGPGQTNQGDWTEHYQTVDEMIAASDYIVIGTVIEQYTEVRFDVAFTISEVKIVQGFDQNTDPGLQSILILQTGGKSGDIETAPIEDVLMLQKDKSYLLFLRKTDDGKALVMGGFQGVASIIGDKVYFPDNHAFVENRLNQIKVDDIENLVRTNQ